MATANVIELEHCITQCLAYCDTHPQHEFVTFYAPRLVHAKRKWDESVKVSDQHYLAWQKEARDDRIAWRKLATELASTQNQLRKVNAVGYPDETVRHWDEEILTAIVKKMVKYLSSRADVITIADERIEALNRALGAAQGEGADAEVALRSFKRHVLFRAEALGTLNASIGEFRASMRRALGKKSDEYTSIRWPMTLSPDEPVL